MSSVHNNIKNIECQPKLDYFYKLYFLSQSKLFIAFVINVQGLIFSIYSQCSTLLCHPCIEVFPAWVAGYQINHSLG